MTFLEAAKEVLAEAGAPLHFEEIARRALVQGKITSTGATPGETMGARLYIVTKEGGSEFERVGKGVFRLARKQPGGIESLVEEIRQRTRAELHSLLARIAPKRFEALIMELLLQMGFDEKTVSVTQYVKDGGIDVLGTYSAAGLTAVNAAVQVKRWKHNVQSQTVTQLRGSLQIHQYGIIITTSDFTKSARLEAEAPGKARISLINGERLVDLLIQYEVGVTTKPQMVTRLDRDWWGEVLDTEPVIHDEAVPLKATTPVNASSAELAPAKPNKVTILGEASDVHSWKDVLLAVAERLAELHPTDFAVVAQSVRGRTRQYVAASPDGMIAPAAIAETGLWIEANQSAATVQRIGTLLMQAFGYGPQDILIDSH